MYSFKHTGSNGYVPAYPVHTMHRPPGRRSLYCSVQTNKRKLTLLIYAMHLKSLFTGPWQLFTSVYSTTTSMVSAKRDLFTPNHMDWAHECQDTQCETLSLTMLFLVDTNAFRQKSHEYGQCARLYRVVCSKRAMIQTDSLHVLCLCSINTGPVLEYHKVFRRTKNTTIV